MVKQFGIAFMLVSIASCQLSENGKNALERKQTTDKHLFEYKFDLPFEYNCTRPLKRHSTMKIDDLNTLLGVKLSATEVLGEIFPSLTNKNNFRFFLIIKLGDIGYPYLVVTKGKKWQEFPLLDTNFYCGADETFFASQHLSIDEKGQIILIKHVEDYKSIKANKVQNDTLNYNIDILLTKFLGE